MVLCLEGTKNLTKETDTCKYKNSLEIPGGFNKDVSALALLGQLRGTQRKQSREGSSGEVGLKLAPERPPRTCTGRGMESVSARGAQWEIWGKKGWNEQKYIDVNSKKGSQL